MSHDDSSDRAGSPLITQPSTGWVGWAVEQTESVLRAIPALLCNAPYPREPAQGGTRYAIIPPLHGRRKSRDRHPDPREVAVSDHNRQTDITSASRGDAARRASAGVRLMPRALRGIGWKTILVELPLPLHPSTKPTKGAACQLPQSGLVVSSHRMRPAPCDRLPKERNRRTPSTQYYRSRQRKSALPSFKLHDEAHALHAPCHHVEGEGH